MKHIQWTAQIKHAPTVEKYCKRCGCKTAFVSSNLFRINAQQRHLDVWLIYRCGVCDTTWNLTVLSRINPHSIAPETLQRFQDNDPDLAMRYALDTPLIRQNGGEPRLPVIEITGPPTELTEPVRIHLRSEHPTEIKILTVLRDQLGLSRSALERMHETGRLRIISGQSLKKCKLAGEVVIEIN
ncbi:MAG: DUF1062 domain-containing protein [Oscillospiraceae bacterium]|nr:DUF1062 domain-containing protein [Oscillospiraceae bacterium]